jgi:exodeoxyribonuclease V alpha subunit
MTGPSVGALPATVLERTDVRRVRAAPGILRAFNDAAVLSAADVHVARRLVALTDGDGDPDDAVLLGVALAVRAPRLGHVCVDLSRARHEVTADTDVPVDLAALPWPDPAGWLAALTGHPLVSVGVAETDHADRPLRLVGPRLYLDRYWRQERRVVDEVRARSAAVGATVDDATLAAGLARLFAPATEPIEPIEPDRQRLAAAVAVLRRFAVVAGGPGTGKTTTVARILALLDEQARAAGAPPPRVALAAPTGKAAARLQEAVHHEAARLDVDEATRSRLLATGAATLHRLLGWRPDSHSRFRHHRGNRLPHDVVVVDEASMVSLSLMAKLQEAVRPDARLILVGDPDQLASVEAGAVLGDIVGPAATHLRLSPSWRATLTEVTGQSPPDPDPGGEPAPEPEMATLWDAADPDASHGPGAAGVGDGIVVLRRVHRFGGSIAALADAIQRGDAGAAVSVLASGGDDISWIDADLADRATRRRLEPVRRRIVDAGRAVHDAAHAGDGRAALDGLGAVRVLCAHRHGPYGVGEWMPVIERWLVDAVPGYGVGGRWYVGRPLLVTENDYGLQLYNGDAGVIIDTGDRGVRAAFERRGEPVLLSPARLGAVETVHAMTVHKSQGSQFGAVTVLLPDESSPLLSRELLYTAVTRAQHHLTVVGTGAAVRAAVERPVARASGLQAALWPEP